uniref:Uncharacterized protein n=1 Tax=Mesocestoides corti TaxID=53468 RepID=A0A5K3EFW0_MESCO
MIIYFGCSFYPAPPSNLPFRPPASALPWGSTYEPYPSPHSPRNFCPPPQPLPQNFNNFRPLPGFIPTYIPPFFTNSVSVSPDHAQTTSISRKRCLPNWKERCLADPWSEIQPKRTPDGGDRLITNAANQRHTVLFAPRQQKSSVI